jgi:hypothetical protein
MNLLSDTFGALLLVRSPGNRACSEEEEIRPHQRFRNRALPNLRREVANAIGGLPPERSRDRVAVDRDAIAFSKSP